jgi:hypothetical protein
MATADAAPHENQPIARLDPNVNSHFLNKRVKLTKQSRDTTTLTSDSDTLAKSNRQQPIKTMPEAFEREKACYEHNATQMRSLNEQMNRVPTVSLTITGGLWFAAAQIPALDGVIKFGLLIFAGFANVGLTLACFRIRDVIQSYLENMRSFEPKYFVEGIPARPFLKRFSHYSMITVYASLMIIAAIMSFIGAFYFYWPFANEYRVLGIAILFAIIFIGGAWITSGGTKKS